jgi:hypothetical protein
MARFVARHRVLARATLHRRGRMGEEQPFVLTFSCECSSSSITRTVIICNSSVFDTNSLHFNLFNTRLKCFFIHCLEIFLVVVYVPRKATQQVSLVHDRYKFIMLYRDRLYRRVQCSLRVAIDARVNKRSSLSVSCRTAVALSQLQVESCIDMLYCFAMLKADSGASNHANLGLLRSPSFQSLVSSRRASANTFGFLCFTSPH